MRSILLILAALLIAYTTAPFIGFWSLPLQVGLSILFLVMEDRDL